MLEINGVPAAKFIKEAYGLGENLDGRGNYDPNNAVQTELRHVRDWITMAEQDALQARA